MINTILDIIRLLNDGNIVPMQKDEDTKIDLYNEKVQLFMDASGEESKYYYFSELEINDENQDNLAEIEDVALNSDAYTVIEKPTPSGTVVAEATEMVSDQIIIPTKSVKASDENNIVSAGPMRNATTSFQIPNGTADIYEKEFAKVEKSDFLQITFDDNGYTKIKQQLDESRITAYMLCGIGFLAVMVIILLLLYFFIIRQKKRLAIERAMGAGKNQCRISMIGGMALFVLVAAILGSILGTGITGNLLQKENKKEAHFSTDYSVQKKTEENASQDTLREEVLSMETVAISLIIPVSITVFVVLISVWLVNRQLNMELMILLGDREN